MVRPIKEIAEEIAEITRTIGELNTRLDNLQRERFAASLGQNKQARERKAAREKALAEKWQGQLEVGDYVRVVGGRNSRTNWRKIVSVNLHPRTGLIYSITGITAAKTHPKKNNFTIYGYMSTNGIKKVVEVLKAGDVEV